MGASFFLRQVLHHRDVDRQVWCSVGEGHTLLQRCIGVDHRRRNVLVVGEQPLFERLDRLVHRPRLDEGLGRAAPDHHQPVGTAGLLEVVDVLAKLLDQFHLVFALLHVGAVELLDVVLVEDGLARLDGRQERLHLFQQRALEHACLAGGGVHVVFEDVPAGEDQVVQTGQGNEFLDLGEAAFGALTEADGAHLGERADRARNTLAYGFDAGDKGRRHRAHSGDHDPQFSFGRRNIALGLLRIICWHAYESVS